MGSWLPQRGSIRRLQAIGNSAGRRVVSHGWVFDKSFAGQEYFVVSDVPVCHSFSKRLIDKVGGSIPP